MADIEKGITTLHEHVSKAIELCYTAGYNCNKCPYYNQYDCNHWLMRDALFLLREQEHSIGAFYIKEPDCRICGQSSCRYYHETRKPKECGSYVRYEPKGGEVG